MQYLVTGGAGCVGTAVVEALLSTGSSVFAVDLIDYPSEVRAYLDDLGGTLSFKGGDVRIRGVLESISLANEPLAIIHCAAHTPNPDGERGMPRSTLIENIDATLAVLEFARSRHTHRFVYVSSGGVYGDLRGRVDLLNGKVSEEKTAPQPRSLYAIAKYSGELAVQRYHSLWDLPICIARVGLTYGPWERLTGARQLVSAPHQMISLARRGKDLVLERESWRGWTSSRDMATGLVGLATASALEHEIYNVATSHRWPLSAFGKALVARNPVRMALADAEPPSVWLRFDFDSPNFDIARLEQVVGTGALMRPEAGIEDYLDWADRFWSEDFMPI